MIETMIKISCDWCTGFDELEKTLHKGIGEKTFEKKSEERGWLKVVTPKGARHFCNEDCKTAYLKNETK
jgi:hypothetical protein